MSCKEWIEKAEKDLKRAKLLFSNEDFEGCAFHSHQAAEKALKAVYISKFKSCGKPMIWLEFFLNLMEIKN